MTRLRRKFSVSERRACRGVGFSRTSIRYHRREKSHEAAIRKRLHELSRQRLRFVYRQMTRLLRLEGFRVSFKRVHRIWKAEGLRVLRKPKEKRTKGKFKND
ncbi:MAG: IS3 family transposase [Planctomycetaceae bacterium]|nr:IS3 family transposase [Planctomycetaceae bacterium]